MRVRPLALAIFAGLVLTSCMRANVGVPVTPIDVRNATPGAPSGDVPQAKGVCTIRDQRTTLDLKMRAGNESFEMRVMAVPTESTLDRDGSAIVHVVSAIELEGRVALAQTSEDSAVWLHVGRETALLGGLVKVGANAAIFKARHTGDAASGTVLLGGYEVEGLAVPCESLVFGESTTAWPSQLTSSDEDTDEERETSWVTAYEDTLSVCASPAGTDPCVRTKEMTFEERGRRGGNVEIRARFSDGSEIHGWAKANELKKADEPARGGYGASGGCGCGRGFTMRSQGSKPDPREHFGKARLKAGSSIYARPDLTSPWAKAAQDVDIEIMMYGPDEHAQVTELPGITTSIGCDCTGIVDHAWVKRESVAPIR